MTLAKRSVVTIDDLTNGEIEAVFSLANEMSATPGANSSLCQGKIMASLFFEPSTRTRLSFESAMHRLGGSVITVADGSSTSLAKGESLADMARVVGNYADLIVIRHPWEGAARVFADYAGIPVINAGDGSHEHPTQTLCDLYTIQRERKTITGLKIALWGDLKHGRTIHSLTYALARFGATIHFRSGPGLELPEHVKRKLSTEYVGKLERYDSEHGAATGSAFPLDAIYLTPSQPHQLANIPSVSIQVELKGGVDALYITRLQKERLPATNGGQGQKDYPVVDKKLLKEKEFARTLVMHPLPRVDELARELDADERSMYFKQAALGIPIRMALMTLLLGTKEVTIPEAGDFFTKRIDHPLYQRDSGLRCENPVCVSRQETEMKYIKPEFKIVSDQPLTLRCTYCEHEIQPGYIASADWHEGRLDSKKYHRADSHLTRKIKPENLIIFDSESTAQARGFKPGYYSMTHQPEEGATGGKA